MLLDQVPEPRLTTKLVDSLGDLVAGGVAESREEGKELVASRGFGGLSEDNGVEVAEIDLKALEKSVTGESVERVRYRAKSREG